MNNSDSLPIQPKEPLKFLINEITNNPYPVPAQAAKPVEGESPATPVAATEASA